MVHIESGLMAYGAEATEQNTPWEVDMGWAVSRSKGDFRGKQALFELEGKEKENFSALSPTMTTSWSTVPSSSSTDR